MPTLEQELEAAVTLYGGQTKADAFMECFVKASGIKPRHGRKFTLEEQHDILTGKAHVAEPAGDSPATIVLRADLAKAQSELTLARATARKLTEELSASREELERQKKSEVMRINGKVSEFLARSGVPPVEDLPESRIGAASKGRSERAHLHGLELTMAAKLAKTEETNPLAPLR